jgi:hypothetical protein
VQRCDVLDVVAKNKLRIAICGLKRTGNGIAGHEIFIENEAESVLKWGTLAQAGRRDNGSAAAVTLERAKISIADGVAGSRNLLMRRLQHPESVVSLGP